MFGPKYFFVRKRLLAKKNFWSEKNFWSKKFQVQNEFRPKLSFGPKYFFFPKKVGKKMLGKNLVKKEFKVQQVSGPKKFGSKIILSPKILSVKKKFLV